MTPRPRAFRLTGLAAACSLLLGGAAPALAQQAPSAEPAKQEGEQVETIVVTGIRKSLDTSLNLKRNAQGIVDGIVAEDIGKFPDTNLAESMQRISGVSIDRSLGEGSKVTVRGIGPDFNLVLLNGRQMPTAAIESTAASNSRAFDFANLASESIAALEVYKTSRAATPAGGMGATINIKTARPLDNPGLVASLGVKGVYDTSNDRLPSSLKGSSLTPEVSGIYSNTFADGTFGIALSGSYQERNLGYNEAGVPNGWRTFRGDENNWGTIPQPGQPGSERIVNRPGPDDIYSVPQNLLYAVNGIQRQRTNGQLTLQYAPSKEWTATLDYTYSENKIQTKRNELSAWFNFGPSSSSWTDGPVSGPNYYSEIVANSDIAMGGGLFATKNTNDSLGFNLAWKPSKALSLELDAHHSTAESGADSPYGSSAVIGTASFNRGTTTADFTHDFPVLSIEGSQIDPSLMQVTGSSFRNSYMKSEIDQAQFRGKYKFEEGSQLDFGVSLTDAKNRSAYGFVQRDTWGGIPGLGPAQTPDEFWHADTIRHYFPAVGGSNDPALFNQFFTWDFGTVRDFAAQASGDESLYRAPTTFSVDRRVQEKSQSAYVQYTTDWEWVVPMQLAAGLRYEQTDVTSRALVPTATGVNWTGNNEYSVVFGAPSFTKLKGKYSYVLPSIDFDADLTSQLKLRASYGESIGRPGWNYIQGGQTLDQLARFGGGTGSQGNPGLKPLLSHNFDLSLEYYYAKGSYVAASYFNKFIENYVGVGSIQATPFNLRTPANGVYFQEAVSSGGCGSQDLTCIRNYIFEHYNGTNGVNGTYDANTGTWSGTIAGQPNDPIMPFTITVPTNARSSRLQGVELNWQHMFGRTGFGVSANYTYVDSGLKYKNNVIGDQFALVGLSDTANLVVFYENDKFDARLAYNWRSEFLTATVDGGGNQNPVYTEPYAQLDLSMGYKWNDRLSFQFEAINLTDSIVRLHERTKNEIVGVYQTGPRYMIGARYKF